MRILALFGRPEFLRNFHGACIMVWAVLWLVASVTGWVNLVAFISHVTMATAVLTSFAAWQAARVEVNQNNEIEKKAGET